MSVMRPSTYANFSLVSREAMWFSRDGRDGNVSRLFKILPPCAFYASLKKFLKICSAGKTPSEKIRKGKIVKTLSVLRS